jgi:hypothetical protein
MPDSDPTLTDAGVLARHPRPWRWHYTFNEVRDFYTILDDRGDFVLTFAEEGLAAFITAACNAYELPEDPTP